MARFRKATPVRDHLPGILAGVVSALLVAFIIWAAPAVKGGLSDSEGPPQVESVTPDQEKGRWNTRENFSSGSESVFAEMEETSKSGDDFLAFCFRA